MTAGIASRTVDWWSVHEFVAARIAVDSWPIIGTLAWQQLDDDDPGKLAAILDAARHHALRIDAAQAARAEAGQQISSAADWSAVARRVLSPRDESVYIPRKQAS
jgi:hypothetical protein